MIIVVGMHRSGTSLLAGLLHHHNIIMGEEKNFFPQSSSENIKGFYENYKFRLINDKIVEKSGYKIKSWLSDIPEIKTNFFFKYQMGKILKKYDKKYDKWGFKDPRVCLTLGTWLEQIEKVNLLNSCKILFIIRNPFSVANSMVKRKNTNFETAVKLWIKYNKRAMDALDNKLSLETHFIAFEDLCNQPVKTAKKCFDFIGLPAQEEIILNFIDPRLNRSEIKTPHKISNDLQIKLDKMTYDFNQKIYL